MIDPIHMMPAKRSRANAWSNLLDVLKPVDGTHCLMCYCENDPSKRCARHTAVSDACDTLGRHNFTIEQMEDMARLVERVIGALRYEEESAPRTEPATVPAPRRET